MLSQSFLQSLGYGAIVLGAAIGVGASTAQAFVITTGCSSATSCLLSELDNGATIQVGDLLFEDWFGGGLLFFGSFPYYDYVEPVEIERITVSGFTSGNNTYGLFVNLNNEVMGGSSLFTQFFISYNVTSLGAPIQRTSLASSPSFSLPSESEFGDPFAEVDVSITAPDRTELARLSNLFRVGMGTGVYKEFDSAEFPPQPSVGMSLESSTAAPGEGNITSIYSLTQTFSTAAVSEPATLGGIVAVASLLGLRRRQQGTSRSV